MQGSKRLHKFSKRPAGKAGATKGTKKLGKGGIDPTGALRRIKGKGG